MRKSPKVGIVVKIVKSGNRYNAVDADNNVYTSYIRTGTRKKAYMSNMALECREGKSGRIYWWKVPMEQFGAQSHVPCLLYTSPSPRDATLSRMPSSA